MLKTKIKNTDLEIFPINFGGNVFGWTLDEKQSFEILDRFTGKGGNFIDTADTYSWWINGVGGQSETIIGNWMRSRKKRNELVIATKVGSHTKEHGYDTSRKHILTSVDQSLQRLKTDHIDLYYTHYDDRVTPIEETLRAYEDIIKAGKIRYIGASNFQPERLIESLEFSKENNLPGYIALQPHYNLIKRSDFENIYGPFAEKYDLSVFSYWSLASGFLTGKYRTKEAYLQSKRHGSLKNYFDERGLKILETIDVIAEKYSVQHATIALAWLISKPLVTAPVVSATNNLQLEAIFEAVSFKMEKEDLDKLDEVSS